ncbi:xanthine dehydrogenase family protein molybdopterin-binding subunit [Ancylobacter pratisalsi]|uniref:Xanthine dehydrogenase family protein molybdopterin-binding subunit n=1 Tax=Ancylobacter pratisalsi TaxID=1745854 RepID=A0A6P1YMA1_9HYPH|nr:molybdopterin cofactor-binding domain-containing protein [Ancylobacter pratisalsi]QIB34567.1 xanthine dehydrogenase family protein molybdopterin-binding subunit [Ancylobacter pratisalsi]
MNGPELSRRSLLRAGAALVGGLIIGIGLPVRRARADEPAPVGASLNAFVHVPTEGPVRLVMPAVEMGQGVYTSQAMCLAEELDIGLDQVVAVHAPADQADYGNPIFVIQATGGSTTTMAWTEPLRKAGATARAMLVAAAAAEWNVDASELTTDKGVISHAGSGRTLSYGAVADRAAAMPPPADVALKSPDKFQLIGTSQPRIDTPAKATGATVYGIDVIRPGMSYASLMAPPVIGGTVAHVEEAPALAVPGVRQVVVLDDMVAVIASNSWAALQGLRALQIEWTPGPNARLDQAQLWAGIEKASEGPGVPAQKEGDALAKLGEGTLFEATYELPFLAHTPMEPMNCTVHVHDGVCDVWVGTQVPGKAQDGAAKVLGIEPAKVTINNHLIGGGFGRRLEADYVITATRIAQKVDGPVKVIWSREEDIRQDPFRPLYHDRLKALLENGRITAWHHRVTGASILARWLPPAFKDGIDGDAVDGAVHPPYAFGDILVDYVRHESPVPVAFWRGVGPNSSIFSIECFLDLIARKTDVDPVAFRRNLLEANPRALAALNAVVAKAGWGTPAPASAFGGRVGRGVALMHAFGSYLGCVADVAVNDAGDVRVTRVVVAADVGRVINPDTVLAQIQGGVTFGITTVLHNKVTIAGGRVEQSNFHDYRLIRIDEMPAIEVDLLASTENPGGIGEPGTVIVQPAVANAIFAATGVQLTRMPVDAALIAKAV